MFLSVKLTSYHIHSSYIQYRKESVGESLEMDGASLCCIEATCFGSNPSKKITLMVRDKTKIKSLRDKLAKIIKKPPAATILVCNKIKVNDEDTVSKLLPKGKMKVQLMVLIQQSLKIMERYGSVSSEFDNWYV